MRKAIGNFRRDRFPMLRLTALAITGLAFAVFGVGLPSALAGDSFYGKVTEVKSAEVVVLDSGAGHYDIHLVSITAPKEGPFAQQARQFISKLLLNKHARMRLEQRMPNGELLSRLFTDDPTVGIKDVGVLLVNAGLARRQSDAGYKYGELAVAEREAQTAKRGLWSAAPQ